MEINYFTFNGVSSLTYNAKIETPPDFIAPQRKVTKQSVVGRSGDLIIDTGAYGNITRTYEIAVPKDDISACVEALLGTEGYCVLADSYDTSIYRKAAYIGPLNLANQLNKFGKAKVAFDCKPQCYLVSGDTAVSINSGASLTNNYREALPMFVITGTGPVTFSVGSNSVTIETLGDTSSTLYLDAEVQDCYFMSGGGKLNANSLVTLDNDFPVLKHGTNTITWTGNVTSFSVTPRWWRLA